MSSPDLTLVSMPYASFSRRDYLAPALPLGVLKSYLAAKGFRTHAIHAHLSFLYETRRYEDHDFVAQSFKLPVVHAHGLDMLYMSLTHEMGDGSEAFRGVAEGLYATRRKEAFLSFEVFFRKLVALRRYLSASLDRLIERIDLDSRAFGMSCIHGQMFASIELTRRLKQRRPTTPVIFGGIDCHADTGKMIIRRYPWVDYVAHEEGEQPLLDLLQRERSDGPIDGCVSRDAKGDVVVTPSRGFVPLAELPRPDFSEFFAEVAPEDLVDTCIPVFASRGCPWNRCTFCNLPVDRQFGYRTKDGRQFTDEIVAYAEEHPECLEYILVDDDVTVSNEFFDILAKRVRDMGLLFSGHGWARRFNRPMLERMKECGFFGMEVGIEAFSEGLLNTIHKGNDVAENLKVLKLLREVGIESWSNIIPFYPGETRAQVEETLQTVEAAKHLLYGSHLTLSRFALYPRTPIWKEPEKYGLRNVRLKIVGQLPDYDIQEGAWFVKHDFDQDTSQTEDLWAQIEARLARYEEVFHPCFYRRVGGTVVVIDYRHGGERKTHVFRELEAKVFDACLDRPLRPAQIAKAIEIDEAAVRGALEALDASTVMFRSGDRWFSLPTRIYPEIERFLAERIDIEEGGAPDPFDAIRPADPGATTRALLVIDVQTAFMNENTAHLPAQIREYIDAHGEEYAAVMFTIFKNEAGSLFQTWHEYDGCMTSPDIDVVPPLDALAGPENTFAKLGFSAFANEDLLPRLRSLGVGAVDIVGLDTDACIMATAMDALRLGVRPRVLAEHCASSSGREGHLAGLGIISRSVDSELAVPDA